MHRTTLAWITRTLLAPLRPLAVVLFIRALAELSTPHPSRRALLTAAGCWLLLFALATLSAKLAKTLPRHDWRPELALWVLEITATIFSWHAAAVAYGGDLPFSALATLWLTANSAATITRLVDATLSQRPGHRQTLAQLTLVNLAALIAADAAHGFYSPFVLPGTAFGGGAVIAAHLWRVLINDLRHTWHRPPAPAH